MLNRTLTTIARQKKAKEKALKWTSQAVKEPYENHSEKNRALQDDVLIEGLARSSNNQGSENTCRQVVSL